MHLIVLPDAPGIPDGMEDAGMELLVAGAIAVRVFPLVLKVFVEMLEMLAVSFGRWFHFSCGLRRQK